MSLTTFLPFICVAISTLLLIPTITLSSVLLAALVHATDQSSTDDVPFFDNIPNSGEFNSAAACITGIMVAVAGIMFVWCIALLATAFVTANKRRPGWGKHERSNGIALAVLAPLLLLGIGASYFGVLAGGHVGTAKGFKSVGAAAPIFCLLSGISSTVTAAVLIIYDGRDRRTSPRPNRRDSEGRVALTDKSDL